LTLFQVQENIRFASPQQAPQQLSKKIRFASPQQARVCSIYLII